MRKPLLICIAVLVLLAPNVANGQRLSPQGGTITSVTGGAGLTGGGSSGPVTVNVVATAGGGLNIGADSLGLRTDCSGGFAVVWDGDSWECTDVTTASEFSTAITGATNTLAKFTGANAVGNSLWSDNGTTTAYNTNKFTILAASGNTTVAGTLASTGAITDGGNRVYSIAGVALTSSGATIDLAFSSDFQNTGDALDLSTTVTAPGSLTVATTLGVTGLSTLTGGFTLGADSSAASHKITNLTNGSSAQDAAAFGQLATAINAAVSGTTNTTTKFTGTNTVGNAWALDDGTTWGVTNKFTIIEASGNTTIAGTLAVDETTAPVAALLAGNSLRVSNATTNDGLQLLVANATATTRPVLSFSRARGTLASPTAPSSGDNVGGIISQIYDGTALLNTASIETFVDGAVSTNVAPQRIELRTGTTNSRTTRLTIASGGDATFANALTVTGAFTGSSTAHIVGALTEDGNSTLGDATTDTTTVNGTLAVSGPSAGNTLTVQSSDSTTDIIITKTSSPSNQAYLRYDDGAQALGVSVGAVTDNDCSLTAAGIWNCTTLTEGGSAVLSGTISDNTVPMGSSGNLTNSTISDAGFIELGRDLVRFGSSGTGFGQAYFNAASLNFLYGTNATASACIDCSGYNGGFTQFRTLSIADGKNAAIATFTGSTKQVDFTGAVTVAGTTALGDATSDNTTIFGYVLNKNAVGAAYSGTATANNLLVQDTTTEAAGVGGSILFQGAYTGTTTTEGAEIKLKKTNATDGNYSFGIGFATRANGGSLTEQMLIADSGFVTMTGALQVANGLSNTSGLLLGKSAVSTTASDVGTDLSLDGTNVNWRSKLNTGGVLAGYVGAGTSAGNTNQWISVAGTGDVTHPKNLTVNGNTVIGDNSGTDSLTVKQGASASTTGAALAGTVISVEQVDATNDYITFRGTTNKGLLFNNSSAQGDGYLLYDQVSRSLTMATATAVRWQLDSNGSMLVGDTTNTAVGNNVDVVTIGNTGTGQTLDTKALLLGTNTGSYNTTAGGIVAMGMHASMSATRSAGSNGLAQEGFVSDVSSGQNQNYGYVANVSGATAAGNIGYYAAVSGSSGTNWSFYGNAGTIYNAGDLVIDGNTTIGNATTDTAQFSAYAGFGQAADANAQIIVATLSTRQYGIYATNAPSAATVSRASGSFVTTGTYDTTSGNIFSYGGIFGATSTRSAGANQVVNVAASFDASGGQTNQAIRTGAGDVDLNITSGSTLAERNFSVNGNTILGDSAAVDTTIINGVTTINGKTGADDLTVNDTATAQTNSHSIVYGHSTGTYDTTAGALTIIAVNGTSTAARSAGANALSNYGVVGNVSGAQTNVGIYGNATTGTAYAFYGDNGSNYFNVISGTTGIGAAPASDKLTVAMTSTANTIGATYSGTAQTGDRAVINAVNSGTYDATAANRIAYGVIASTSASRSAGANTVTAYGLYATASGGQTNQAIYTSAGDVYLNAASGVVGIATAPNASYQLSVSGTSLFTNIAVDTITSTGFSNLGNGSTDTVTIAGGLITNNVGTSTNALQGATTIGLSGAIGGTTLTVYEAGSFQATNVFNSTTTNGTAIEVDYNRTAQTSAPVADLRIVNTGTFNTTGGAFSASAIRAELTASRSSGANNLTNRAIYATATSAQVNIALQTDDGDVLFNQVSGISSFNNKVQATGTDPTLSSCGTSPSIVGSDYAGTVTVGATGTATACTVTFSSTMSAEPACVIGQQSATGTTWYFSAKSATAFTITTTTGASILGLKFNYVCLKM